MQVTAHVSGTSKPPSKGVSVVECFSRRASLKVAVIHARSPKIDPCSVVCVPATESALRAGSQDISWWVCMRPSAIVPWQYFVPHIWVSADADAGCSTQPRALKLQGLAVFVAFERIGTCLFWFFFVRKVGVIPFCLCNSFPFAHRWWFSVRYSTFLELTAVKIIFCFSEVHPLTHYFPLASQALIDFVSYCENVSLHYLVYQLSAEVFFF